jgi:hypothetical protein
MSTLPANASIAATSEIGGQDECELASAKFHPLHADPN